MKNLLMIIVCLALLMPAVLVAQLYNDVLLAEQPWSGTETSSEFLAGSASYSDIKVTVNNSLEGQAIHPFDYGTSLRRQEANNNEIIFPDGDPTNHIPIGSSLCLLISIVSVVIARIIRVVIQKENINNEL